MSENKFKVVEIFKSISGESYHSGEVAVFVRLYGCNLRCHYSENGGCDTPYGYEGEQYTEMTAFEILNKINELSPNGFVVLTGGEPLIHPKIEYLVGELLKDGSIRVDIETNGSVDIRELVFKMEDAGYEAPIEQLIFTVDYKCPSSRMTRQMHTDYVAMIERVRKMGYEVNVKCVVADRTDLVAAASLARKLLKDNTDDPDLSFGQHFFISPVFGSDVAYIAEYISNISDTLCWCRLQLQMHKYIWDPDKRGV